MKIAGAIFGFLVLAAVFVVWFRAYRSVKGDDGPLFSMGNRKPRRENHSLDEFIAAYKRGDVAVDGNPPVTAKPQPASASAATPPAQPARRDTFISGPTRLVYLACKAGLRDHHIFAHVPLPALSTGGAIDPALVRAEVDLLVCNAAMSPVAAIDMIDAGSVAGATAKADHLKMLGIRYLRLSAKSLPRPDELHGLLYKM